MNNLSIYIIVEGKTEQTFVRYVLAPTLANKKIFLHPVLIGKPGQKGGNVSFERAKRDIGLLLKQRRNTYISTMFDFSQIDPKWPGREEIQKKTNKGTILTAAEKASILEKETHNEAVNLFSKYDAASRFIPYIQMHEFESLLFSDEIVLAKNIGVERKEISTILQSYKNPEEINDEPSHSPSKYLMNLMPRYRKIAMGKTISESIGIETMRKSCSHFNEWLTRLEHLHE